MSEESKRSVDDESPGPGDEISVPDSSVEEALDGGIAAAFGFDSTVDNPTTQSVLLRLREDGTVPRISLRQTEEEPSPVTLRKGVEGGDETWAVGRYQIDGEIARGGVGAIFKARDVDLGREVALKVIRQTHQRNPELVRRFLEEAQIGGQLQHPGIVPIHEVGLLGDDRPYFAMKLVKGQTLGELLEARANAEEDRQRFLVVFEQVCQTLAYSHTRGVIHRDLKPSNVMVGAFGEVQVMDWGLAKVLPKGGVADDVRTTRPVNLELPPEEESESESDDVIRTMRSSRHGTTSVAGSVMGTPAYMPPEQAKGIVDELDERSDVFGLGAMLCEILTGKPPYVGKDIEEIFEKARTGDLEGAKERFAASSVDPELVELSLDCLRFERNDRQRNALVVSKRSRAYLESTERRAEELKMRAARTRLKLVISLLLLALVVLSTGGYVVVDRERRAREDETKAAVSDALARAALLRAREDFTRDASLWDATLTEIRRAEDLAREAGHEVLLSEAEKARHEVDREVRDHRMVAELERLRAERENESEELQLRFAEAFQNYGIDVLGVEVKRVAAQIGESAIRQNLVLAVDHWIVSIGRSRSDRTADRLREIAQLADDDGWRQRLRDAARERDREKLVRLAAEVESKSLAPSTFEVLAFALRDLREGEKAARVWRRAQELHPGDFWINSRLGDQLRYEEKAVEGLQYARAAVALRPRSSYARYKLGSALIEAEAALEALIEFRRAIELAPGQDYESPFNPYRKAAKLIGELTEQLPKAELEHLGKLLDETISISARAGSRAKRDRGLLLAEIDFALGNRREAILGLERLTRQDPRSRRPSGRRGSRSGSSVGESLDRMREAVLPDLVTFASIDLAFDRVQSNPSEETEKTLDDFVRLHAESRGRSTRSRRLYLEGRRLESMGDRRAATQRFVECITLTESDASGGEPAPTLRLARTLRDAGDPASAEQALRRGLSRPGVRSRDVWNLWTVISFVDLGRAPSQLAPFLSSLDSGGDDRSYEALSWLVTALAAHRPLRINCAGAEYTDDKGQVWASDRFYSRPNHSFGPRGWSSPKGEAALRSTAHWFSSRRYGPRAGYEIPLPRGSYRIRVFEALAPWRHGREEERPFVLRVEGQSLSVDGDVGQIDVEVVDGILQIQALESHTAAIEVTPLKS